MEEEGEEGEEREQGGETEGSRGSRARCCRMMMAIMMMPVTQARRRRRGRRDVVSSRHGTAIEREGKGAWFGQRRQSFGFGFLNTRVLNVNDVRVREVLYTYTKYDIQMARH